MRCVECTENVTSPLHILDDDVEASSSRVISLDYDTLDNAYTGCLDYCQGPVKHVLTRLGFSQRDTQDVPQDYQSTSL